MVIVMGDGGLGVGDGGTMHCHPERSEGSGPLGTATISREAVIVRHNQIPRFARDDKRARCAFAHHYSSILEIAGVCQCLFPHRRSPAPIPRYRGIPATILVIVLSCRATTFRRESRSVCNWAMSFFSPPISFAASLRACATAASERGLPQEALNSAALETRSRRSGRMSCRDRG